MHSHATTSGFDASAYLRERLPQLLLGASELHLTLQVLVAGRLDLRTYYTLDGSGVSTHAGFAAAPELTLALQLSQLHALAEGSIDLREALLQGYLALYGDPAKAHRLSRSLTP